MSAYLIELLRAPTKSNPITLSDAADQTGNATKGIWIGNGGTLVGRLAGDAADRTFLNIPSGSYLPGNWSLLKSTGTTCTSIIGYAG